MRIFDFKAVLTSLDEHNKINELSSGETFLIDIKTGELIGFDIFKDSHYPDILVSELVEYEENNIRKKFNLFKFRFDRFRDYLNRNKYELIFKEEKYILISVISYASSKFEHPIIKNIWNIRYQDMNIPVGEKEVKLIDFLVERFEEEQTKELNEIHINNGIFGKEGVLNVVR